MKKFKQHLTEVSDENDKKQRQKASLIVNRLISRLEQIVKTKNPGLSHKLVTTNDSLGVNLGRILREPDWFNVILWFVPESGGFYGAFLTKGSQDNLIQLKVLTKDTISEIQTDPYGLMLKQLNRPQIKQTLYHELIHYLDSSVYLPISGNQGLGIQDYYNQTSEVNAYTQQAIYTIDKQIRKFYLEQIVLIATKVNLYNKATNLEDDTWWFVQLANIANTFQEWINNPQKAIAKLLEKTPQFIFYNQLNSDNKKRFLTRLYQYYQSQFIRTLNLYLNKIKSTVKKLNNSQADEYMKNNNPAQYKTLLKLAEDFHLQESPSYHIFPLGSTKNRYLVFDREPKAPGAQIVGHIDFVPDEDSKKETYWAYLLKPGKSIAQQRVGNFKTLDLAVKAMERK